MFFVHHEGFLASVFASMNHYSSFQTFRHINICLIMLILRCKWQSFKNQINSKHRGPWNLTEACLKRVNVLVGPEKEDLERKHLPFLHSQSLREVLNIWVGVSALARPLPSAPVQHLKPTSSSCCCCGTGWLQFTFLPKEEFCSSLSKGEGVLSHLFNCNNKQHTTESLDRRLVAQDILSWVTGHLSAPNMPAGWLV